MACEICQGIGAVRGVEEDGTMGFVNCECQKKKPDKVDQRLRVAQIPDMYLNVELENYDTDFKSCSDSMKAAKFVAEKYVEAYPVGMSEGNGLIFYGNVGTGKTHLALSVLKDLMRKGSTGIYCDNQALIRLLQSTMDREGITEWDVLRPVVERDVLVLDDLGAFKISEYREEIMTYIMNERYSNKRVTLITTNYPFEPSLFSKRASTPPGPVEVDRYKAEAKEAMRGVTLGDRVGDRVFDRLLQICVPIPVYGNSMRATVKKARL